MSLKIFELVPVVDRIENLKSSQIESFCYSNTILCIGTSDGYILRYSINRSSYLGENIGFKSELIDYKLLNHKKPISLITIATEIKKILYLSDGILNPINFDNLELSSSSSNILKIKNVTTYCFNERQRSDGSNPFGMDTSVICVCLRGKTLQLFKIDKNENNVMFYKEIQLPEYCLQMECNSNYICVACDNSYLVVNMINSSIQKLFTYNIEIFTPFIANHVKGEFLVSCQGNLGMFATYDGETTRPPVAWCENCVQFEISNPYILCMTNDSIKVYGFDSKLKQDIPIVQPKQIKYIKDENIYIISKNNQILALNVASIASQVDQLLVNNQIDEAIDLFENLGKSLDKESYDSQIKIIKIKCGFIELVVNKNFSKAQSLFSDAYLDYKQLVRILPDASQMQNEESIEDETNGYSERLMPHLADKIFLINYKQFIIDYMLLITKLNKNPQQQKNDERYVSILFRLCGEVQPSILSDLDFYSSLPASPSICLQNIQTLINFGRHHAAALVYCLANRQEDGLNIWKDLCDEKLKDDHFPGFEFVIDQLANLKDHQLVWKYVDWAMSKNQAKAVAIFTQRQNDELTSERMRMESIIDNIQAYKEALTLYLEYVVFTKNIKKEKIHTQLVSIYLETVIELLKIPVANQTPEILENLKKARLKLQNILEFSSTFRVQLILGRIREYESHLQKECAILYGKVEEHEKALKILVYILHDYASATNYCLTNSKDSLKQRKKLFNILFSIYMNPSYSDKERLLKPTLELLNSKLSSNFDIPKLINMIPDNWSLKLTGDFLQNMLRINLAKKRNNLVEKNISNNYKFTLQTMLHSAKKEQLYMDEDNRCVKCHKPFESSVFARQPNGRLSHTSCKNDLITFKTNR